MNSPLNACTPTIAPPPRGLPLLRAAGETHAPGPGNGDLANPERVRALLHACRMQSAIPCEQCWRASKERLVLTYGRQRLMMLGFTVAQDMELGDDPTLDFGEHDLAAELDGCAACVPRNDASVRLKQADHLLRGGNLLALQNTSTRLGDDVSHQRKEVVKLCHQAASTLFVSRLPASSSRLCRRSWSPLVSFPWLAHRLSERVAGLFRLPQRVLGRAEQYLVERTLPFGLRGDRCLLVRGRAEMAAHAMQLLQGLAYGPHPIAECIAHASQ